MKHRSLTDIQVRGMIVFCRVDFNVPTHGTVISDDSRIRAALPTLEWLREHGARVVCASHLGRPKGEYRPELSLRPVANRLGEILGHEVPFATDCVGKPAADLAGNLKKGEIGLLENLRFHPGETAGDLEFAEALAAPADLYVNDAFGSAHRAHASVVGVPELLGNAAAGFLMDRELDALGRLADRPVRPYVAILGGAKVSDKIPLIEKLLERVDRIAIGGAMAYTFLAAGGTAVGSSKLESDRLKLAQEILSRAATRGVAIDLPLDHLTAARLDGLDPVDLQPTAGREIDAGRIGLDIGPRTIEVYERMLSRDLMTVLWNGPLGLFEAPGCAAGTRRIAEHLAGLPAFRVLGGGDTAAAAVRFGVAGAFDHISTGGGAALEFLSGTPLPGVVALEKFAS